MATSLGKRQRSNGKGEARDAKSVTETKEENAGQYEACLIVC